MTAEPLNGPAPTIIRCGDMEVDCERHLVRVANRRVDLTFMEFRVLVAIAERAGKVAPYSALAQRFGGASSELHRRRLAVLISRLRSKLGDGARYIDTVQRVGYRLTPP